MGMLRLRPEAFCHLNVSVRVGLEAWAAFLLLGPDANCSLWIAPLTQGHTDLDELDLPEARPRSCAAAVHGKHGAGPALLPHIRETRAPEATFRNHLRWLRLQILVLVPWKGLSCLCWLLTFPGKKLLVSGIKTSDTLRAPGKSYCLESKHFFLKEN